MVIAFLFLLGYYLDSRFVPNLVTRVLCDDYRLPTTGLSNIWPALIRKLSRYLLESLNRRQTATTMRWVSVSNKSHCHCCRLPAKSYSVNFHLDRCNVFFLIRESNSPSPCQFWADRWMAAEEEYRPTEAGAETLQQERFARGQGTGPRSDPSLKNRFTTSVMIDSLVRVSRLVLKVRKVIASLTGNRVHPRTLCLVQICRNKTAWQRVCILGYREYRKNIKSLGTQPAVIAQHAYMRNSIICRQAV